jgi:hypothetical protein
MDTLLGYVVIFLVGCLVGLYVLIVLVGKLIVDSGCFSDRSSKADAEAAEQRERKRERPPEILRQTIMVQPMVLQSGGREPGELLANDSRRKEKAVCAGRHKRKRRGEATEHGWLTPPPKSLQPPPPSEHGGED